MINFKSILLSFYLLFIFTLQVNAEDIQVASFEELINSNPGSGDTIEFLDNMNSDATIGYNFYGLDIQFEGNNYSINGNEIFGGFILNQDSLFNQVRILNCMGQEYNRSNFAGAVYNNGGTIEINSSAFQGNFVDASGFNFAVGGALYNLSGGHIDIDNSLFENNYSDGASSYGGAIANGYQQSGSGAEMTISNSIIRNNYSEGSVVPHGGAIYNVGNINVKNSGIENNFVKGTDGTYAFGGAIYNEGDTYLAKSRLNNNKALSGDYSFVYGGAVYNNSRLEITDSEINNNIVQGGVYSYNAGGAIYNASDVKISGSEISFNNIQGAENTVNHGGAIFNAGNLEIENSKVSDNTINTSFQSDGGAIYNNTDADLAIKNSTIENNSNTGEGNGGAIYNSGKLVIENSIFKNNRNNDTENDIYNNNASIEFNGSGSSSILSGVSGNGTIVKNDVGILNLGGNNSDFKGDFVFNAGTVNLLADSSFFDAQNTNLGNNVNLNTQNGEISSLHFNNLNLNGQTNLFVEADLNSKTMDTVSAGSLNGNGVLFVKNLKLYGTPESEDISIHFADSVLKNYVRYNPDEIKTPIYNYNVRYDSSDGDFNFLRGDFNPSIFTSEVASQLGGYLVQLETYKNVFSNLDMVMITPPDSAKSFSYYNKFAASNGRLAFSPLFMPEQRKGIWFKPYSTFENVPLRHGPKVSNVLYGAIVGGESELMRLKHNWYMMYGAYAAYNGSHQAYQGNSIYNNGGLIGADAVFYKGRFFSAWTVNAGANAAEASTDFGRENFAMLNTGIAQKSGYNFEVFERKMIIQPSIMTSYSFINTFNYTTASNVNINTEPLHALHIEPGIKIIGNFKNYLQPYLSVSMAWNIIDHARFQANDIYLTDLSVKPYVQYGVGVQKRWGERITGFLEGMIRNGGRNGIALLFGLRISL